MMKIRETMLCWNDKTKRMGVVQWPLKAGEDLLKHHGFYSDVGASSEDFRALSTNDQVVRMFAEGIVIARDERIPVQAVFEALSQIDECAEVFERIGAQAPVVDPED